ncbi:hypothetical protein GGF32_006541 [Allomyces javanicus]|nr:hypothetical protein GGF32_006541 [Allomyces javanicus]
MTDLSAASVATAAAAPAPPAPAPVPAPATQHSLPSQQQKKQPKQQKNQQNASQPKQQQPKQQQKQSKKKRKSDIMGSGPGTEQIKRLNFMLQAAHLLSHPGTSAPHPFKRRGDHQRARPAMPALAPVGRHISRELVAASRKATLKLLPLPENDGAMDVDPPTDAPHPPALAFKVVPSTITQCHACGYERRTVHDPDHTLFHDRAQVSLEETMA